MAKRPYKATGNTDGKTMDVAMDEIDGDSVEIVAITRPTDRKLDLSDEARIQTIERRILSGAKKISEVMTLEERDWLEEIGAEVKINFNLRDGKKVVTPKVDGKSLRAITSKTKPKSTLADDLLATKTRTIISEAHNERAHRLLAKARNERHIFVLTESAAIRIGEAIRAYPEMLVSQGWFARTPFETCFIEIPAPAFHEAIVPGTGTPAQDEKVGYLFHQNQVYVGASNGKEEGADFSPLVYNLHTPNSFEEQQRLAHELDVSRMQLDNFFWGKTMSDKLDRDTLRGLRGQHGFSVAVDPKYKDRIKGHEWLGFSAGEVRNIIGLLLMINQPSNIVRMMEVGHRKKMTAKGMKVLIAHSVVTLNLDRRHAPDRLLRRPTGGTHASPKWHDVIDHWCNDKVARSRGHSLDDPRTWGRGDHAHVWNKEETEEGKLRATCSICGGRRWRRVFKNGRGDRSKGTVFQERLITTDADHVKDREYA